MGLSASSSEPREEQQSDRMHLHVVAVLNDGQGVRVHIASGLEKR